MATPVRYSVVRAMGLIGVGAVMSFSVASGCSASGTGDDGSPGDTATGGAAGSAGAGGSDTTGMLRQPCFANHTCFGTLQCFSDVCVDPGGAGAGGTSGIGGSAQGGQAAGGQTTGAGGMAGSTSGGGHAGSPPGAGGTSGPGVGGAPQGPGGAPQGPQGPGGAPQGPGGSPQGAGGSPVGMGGMVGVGGVAGSCAGELYTAKQDPAALLFVLDRSVSMYGTKWQALSEAVTQAMDSTEFDTMFVGFLAAPWGDTAAPQCVVDASGGLITQIPCMAPTDPQIPLTLVGTQPTTDSTSFRAQVKSVLSGSGPKMPDPFGFDPDSSPLYPAIQNALKALKAWPETGKRILVIISDGSIDCNQGSGRPGYPDGNGCTTDWEDPNNIVKLVKDANMDPTTPIQSFVVGVPGADTYDASGANFPPYHMRLALSAIAAAGAPDYVDPTCDGMTYTQSGGDPTKSCHFDMTQGAFTSDTLAKNLAAIRNETLGCAFNLPMPTNGMIVDPTEVNVEVDTGMGLIEVPKRKDPMDTCPDNPCWDYDQNGKVVLIGQECAALKNAQNPQVSIVVGCATIEKP